jgi:hypothetical protein
MAAVLDHLPAFPDAEIYSKFNVEICDKLISNERLWMALLASNKLSS